jgi:hypothetical protein
MVLGQQLMLGSERVSRVPADAQSLLGLSFGVDHAARAGTTAEYQAGCICGNRMNMQVCKSNDVHTG